MAWLAVAAWLLLLVGLPVLADDFDEDLARVDRALRDNPSHASEQALESCRARRNNAVRLREWGQQARAERSLRYCIQVLAIPDETPKVKAQRKGPSIAEIQARAASEVEKAVTLTPDLENGLRVYRDCAMCHMPEGWGLPGGTVPQIAGQHRTVIIKQLADIRAGNRDNLVMIPYSSVDTMGGVQAVADVAGYIDTLEMSVDNGKGSGEDLELGALLYREHCASCHGREGEGDADAFVPRIQAQHYDYLVRQFEWIRDGKRRNANPEMVEQIHDFDERQIQAVLDYVSRLQPPEELRAPSGWRNPDFSD